MLNARIRFAQWGGWAALAGGAVLCVVGWYGVSGERFAERQIPYLASCTVPGAALIVAGAVVIARGDQGLAAARVEELYGLLVAYEDGPDTAPTSGTATPATPPGPDSARLLTVPGGSLLHRPDCPLVAGKPNATPAPPQQGSHDRKLTPCPICEPDTGTAEEGTGAGAGMEAGAGPGADTAESGAGAEPGAGPEAGSGRSSSASGE